MFKSITINPQHPNFKQLKFANKNGDFNLTFNHGINIVSGLNGVGKTTLINIIKDHIFGNADTNLSSINTKSVPHWFFKIKELNSSNMLSNASYENAFDPHYLSMWMDRKLMSHGESNRDTLKDLCHILDKEPKAVCFIDEPELALDHYGLIEFVKFVKKYNQTQFIVISHHPYLLLDKTFNQINLSDNYVNDMQLYLKSLM
jgi:predicted ATPase